MLLVPHNTVMDIYDVMVEGGGPKSFNGFFFFLKKDQTHDFVPLWKTLWITLTTCLVLEPGWNSWDLPPKFWIKLYKTSLEH